MNQLHAIYVTRSVNAHAKLGFTSQPNHELHAIYVVTHAKLGFTSIFRNYY